MNARRQTFTNLSVTYGAIGATLDTDMLRYPPTGFRPAEDSVRIGSGQERFEKATEELMTWGVQLGAGIEVTDISAGTGTQYTGVVYDAEGSPIAGETPRTEQRFSADGKPYLTAGMAATLKWRDRFGLTIMPILVVYVIDEPFRTGFAYGTTADGAETGEESFILERRDDDSVWLTIRSVLHSKRFISPLARYRRKELTQLELRALHPAFV